MNFSAFLIFIRLQKLSLYQFDINKQSKKLLRLIKIKPPQIIKKEWIKSNNKKIFLTSEFPTKIAIFSNTGIRFSRDKNSGLEQKSASNRLINQPELEPISLESKMVDVFVYRFDNLNELQKELVKAASFESNRTIAISSYFAMSTEQKQKLLRVIREKVDTNAQVEFKVEEDLNLGIALRDRGYTIFSNLDCCITELEEKVENQAAKEKSRLKQLIRT